jgi:hypothetical protein
MVIELDVGDGNGQSWKAPSSKLSAGDKIQATSSKPRLGGLHSLELVAYFEL